MTRDLMRGYTGGLANETYWSKSVVSWKQQLSKLKTTN